TESLASRHTPAEASNRIPRTGRATFEFAKSSSQSSIVCRGAHTLGPHHAGPVFANILNLRLSISFKDAFVTCRRGLPAYSCDSRAGPQRIGPRTSNEHETDRS